MGNEKDNIKMLAKTAYDSENWEKSYNYYSQILEEDTNNAEAWKYKGLSAGRIAQPPQSTLKEMTVCIKNALSNGLEEDQKAVTKQMMAVASDYLSLCYTNINKIISDKRKESTYDGQTPIIADVGSSLAFANNYGKQFAKCFESVIESMEYSVELDPSKENYNKLIHTIKKTLVNSSKKLGNFLDNLDKVKPLERKKNKYLSEARSKFSSYQEPETKNCFIATATLYYPNHPKLLTLRIFRDQYLSKSKYGLKFIKYYYKYSPFFARKIADNKLLRRMSYLFLITPLHFYVKKIIDKK